MYEFDLPSSKTKITWKPLTVGAQLDIMAMYPNQPAYIRAACLAARVIQASNKSSTGLTFMEIKAWDEVDYAMFEEHVEIKENERYRSFRKQEARGNVTHAALIEKLRMDMNGAFTVLTRLIDQAHRAVLEAEQGGNVPSPLELPTP